jgi:hypothetical protein
LVLPHIMLIADEVDSQLTQSVDSFLSVQKGWLQPRHRISVLTNSRYVAPAKELSEIHH